MCCKDCQDKEDFYMKMDDGVPYTDSPSIEDLGAIIRNFPDDTPEHFLKWHWDEEDRKVIPLHKTDWQFQFDNKLPQPINSEINIPMGVYHRLIKGTGELKLKIYKK